MDGTVAQDTTKRKGKNIYVAVANAISRSANFCEVCISVPATSTDQTPILTHSHSHLSLSLCLLLNFLLSRVALSSREGYRNDKVYTHSSLLDKTIFACEYSYSRRRRSEKKKNRKIFNALQINLHNVQRDNDNQVSKMKRESGRTRRCVSETTIANKKKECELSSCISH